MTRVAKGLTDRIRMLATAAGSQRKLAEIIGVTAPTIIGWMAGSEPYESTFDKIANRTGLSREWLRDGKGSEDEEIERFRERFGAKRFWQTHSQSSMIREAPPSMECPMIASGSGPMAIVERTAMRLDARSIAMTIADVLGDAHSPPSERNSTAKRLCAALLKKLDAEGRAHTTKH